VIYRCCIETCQRLGIDATSAEGVRQRVSEWNAIFAGTAEATAKLH
jgi:hypothetical protein